MAEVNKEEISKTVFQLTLDEREAVALAVVLNKVAGDMSSTDCGTLADIRDALVHGKMNDQKLKDLSTSVAEGSVRFITRLSENGIENVLDWTPDDPPF